MTKVSLFKQDGSQIGEIELNAAVFGVEPNEDVIFDAVIMNGRNRLWLINFC